MLHMNRTKGADGSKPASSLSKDLLHMAIQPVVWAPFLAIILLCVHVALPAMAIKSVGMIGGTAGGVALFAAGVMLYGFSFRIDREFATVFVLMLVTALTRVIGTDKAAKLANFAAEHELTLKAAALSAKKGQRCAG
jgi:predicted permease